MKLFIIAPTKDEEKRLLAIVKKVCRLKTVFPTYRRTLEILPQVTHDCLIVRIKNPGRINSRHVKTITRGDRVFYFAGMIPIQYQDTLRPRKELPLVRYLGRSFTAHCPKANVPEIEKVLLSKIEPRVQSTLSVTSVSPTEHRFIWFELESRENIYFPRSEHSFPSPFSV